MCMRLVVCAKQQKPMARLPGPLLRLAARVVRACLLGGLWFRFCRTRQHVGPHSVSHLIDCAAEGHFDHPPETPLQSCTTGSVPRNEVMSIERHTATACNRGSNVRLTVARAEEGLRKSGLPRVDRHKCTAEATPCGGSDVQKPRGKRAIVQGIMGAAEVSLRRKMAVWKICPR